MTMLIIEILMILEIREIIGNAKREHRGCRERVQEESRVRAKIDQRERTESSGSVDGEQRAEKMQRECLKRVDGEQR